MKTAIKAVTLTVVLFSASLALADDIDFERTHDFSTYATYSWLEPHAATTIKPLGASIDAEKRLEAAHELITKAVERELAAKGLKQSAESNADFHLRFHTAIDHRFEIHADYPYRRARFRHLPVTADIDSYEEGTLLIDVIDAKTDSLVWRSSVTRSIQGNDLQKTIDRAVAKALRKFPPKAK